MNSTNKKRLAVVPTDPIELYLNSGYGAKWLKEYFNPLKFFDEVYVLSPNEKDNPDLLGMQAIRTTSTQFARRLKELRIDVVRAYGAFWPCELACTNKVNNVPVVVSVHDTNPELLWDSIAKADAVYAMTHEVRRLVLDKHKNPDRVWVLPNRIHFDYMRPYSKEEIGSELDSKYPFKYKLIHVGRRSKQKNLDNIIKSLKVLGKDYCLLAVGKGDAQEYISLARDWGVLDQCFFIEAISNEELAKYYSWADCVCMPSRWEGFGMVISEALAAEGVLLTSDLPPMTEFVQHGFNGLLLKDLENHQALAELVRQACTDVGLRKILKSNARKSVECFEQSKVDTLEASYYQKVLDLKEQGAFRQSWKQKVFYSSIGKKVRPMIPMSIRKRFLGTV